MTRLHSLPPPSKNKRATILHQCPECKQWRWIAPGHLKESLTGKCAYCSKKSACWKHGESMAGNGGKATPTYMAWANMRQRCLNPACSDYKDYAGRGIRICKRWDSFENFKADMGEHPGLGYSLGRINNDGPYSPRNCEWQTAVQQNNNTRKNRRANAST